MPRRTTVPMMPTLPQGIEVASFGTYLDAQQAVDRLSDEAFPVQHVSIVGTDLHLVERITGRLTYARVAGAGAMSGAWFGLLISLIFVMFTPTGEGVPLLAGIVIGAAFGILFGVVSYAFTGGKRDFTSSSQVVAGRYAIICAAEHAGKARELLRSGPTSQGGTAAPRPAVAPRPAAPPDPGNPYASPAPGVGQPAPGGQSADAPEQRPASATPRPADDEPPRYGVRIAPPQDGSGDDAR